MVPGRVLVTGGRGQLGEEIALLLAGREGPGGRRVEVWAPGRDELDVTDFEAVRAALRAGGRSAAARPASPSAPVRAAAGAAFGGLAPDLVIHAAAMTDVDACELDPEAAYRINALGARNVAVACREVGATMVYVSTDYVFDGAKGSPYSEDDPVGPVNVYGRSKLLGEVCVREELSDHYVVRTSWLYGRAGRPNFVRAVLGLARDWRERRGEPLRMVADQVGGPTYTRDLAEALLLLVRRSAYGTYHLSNAGSCSRWEFARAILDMAGYADVPLEPVSSDAFPRPARRPAYSVLENAAWRREGFPPLRPWREALREYLSLYLSGRATLG